MNATKERVGILARAATTKIGQCVGSGPEGLQEAQNLGCLRVTVGAGGANLGGELAAFYKSTMLHCNCEKGRAADFFPQIY